MNVQVVALIAVLGQDADGIVSTRCGPSRRRGGRLGAMLNVGAPLSGVATGSLPGRVPSAMEVSLPMRNPPGGSPCEEQPVTCKVFDA